MYAKKLKKCIQFFLSTFLACYFIIPTCIEITININARGINPQKTIEPEYRALHFESSNKPKVLRADCIPCLR